jgi:hypothetical protein
MGIVLRWLERGFLGFLALAAALYLGDLATFQLRGRPNAQVVVHHYLAVPLKGGKTEYDSQGSGSQSCAEAVFPREGLTPCWYLRGHTNQTIRP